VGAINLRHHGRLESCTNMSEPDEKYGCIYLITNLVNGKMYVGQYVEPTPDKRWKKHIQSAKRGDGYILHDAINKYGSDNFTIEALCICKHEALGNMEAYYAEQYGTYTWDHVPGYNMVWCGDQPRLGMSNSLEAREKISRKNRGKKFSKEELESMRKPRLEYVSTETIQTINQIKEQKIVTNTETRRFICQHTNCKYSANHRGNFNKHMLTHTDERPFSCEIRGCEHRSTTKQNLIVHMRIHSHDKPFRCQVSDCGYSATTNDHLKVHMRIHSHDKPFRCQVAGCQYNGTTSGNLKTHMRGHSREHPYICDFDDCIYSATTNDNLKVHMRIHTGERPFPCVVAGCEYIATTSGSLKRHMHALHTEQPEIIDL